MQELSASISSSENISGPERSEEIMEDKDKNRDPMPRLTQHRKKSANFGIRIASLSIGTKPTR